MEVTSNEVLERSGVKISLSSQRRKKGEHGIAVVRVNVIPDGYKKARTILPLLRNVPHLGKGKEKNVFQENAGLRAT